MKKENIEHLGLKIKKIRSFRGMTQDELARAINKTRSMVSHIERTGEVNYYTLKEISKVLNLTTTFLENNNYEDKLHIVSEPLSDYESKENNNLMENLKEENTHLKDIIQNQWKLIFELNKK
jgi:transcriptional regulator with XRE-family HTH domain